MCFDDETNLNDWLYFEDYRDAEYYICGLAGDYCVLETIKNLKPIWDRLRVYLPGIASIDEKKPVFVFNQYDSTWLLWDYSMKAFREYRKTPTLTRNFAGIGTRNLQANGLQAIIDCYTETTTEKTLFD